MSLNWNYKMWGSVAVVIILLSASGLILSMGDSEKESVSILARVNNDGSGIFIRADTENVDDMTEVVDGVLTAAHPELWEGKVFMTPGPSSIQHMILMDIVKEDLGLNFVQYGTAASDAVFWTQVGPGLMLSTMTQQSSIDGGIAWEPHYSVAVNDGLCIELMTTSDYWQGHPCCVIAANNSFLSGNENATERFLAAYVSSVLWVTEAMSDTSTPEYAALLDITKRIGTPESSGGPPMSDEVAEAALANITYAYEIGNLTQQLADVVDTYKSLNIVQQSTLSDAGYDSSLAFTDHLVRGEYIADVLNDGGDVKGPAELGYYGGAVTHIGVAYLAADIHQIALHVGIEQGFFADYGIEIELIGPFGAGGDVMNALLSGHASIGFVGSPPVVSSSINALRS
ncbi:MAG: ABC transporter substrate-binding protein [Candidatus Methanomethylophilaceae archaeon]|nr:sulfonate transport system substrate-binding protein [Candidatus Methanomethylophilaceae archaeon]